jgi:hypothetical protein
MMRSVVVSMVLIPIRFIRSYAKRPRRVGGRGVGAIWGSAEGAALRRFGCEWITPSWDALSSFAHPTCQASAEVCFGCQTRTSSLGPHVRFRRGQTLIQEGSPLVKPRNSA